MVGSGIKKFAVENNFHIKEGVAYGNYKGYMLTLQEGSGWKSAAFAARIETEEAKGAIAAFLSNSDNAKQFALSQYNMSDSKILIVFNDTIGTMKKMISFIEVFTKILAESGAKGISVCSYCGQSFEGTPSVNVLVDGAAFVMHPACADTLNTEADYQQEKNQNTGNTLMGVVGALLGGIIGSIPWAVALFFGWFVGWFGFITGIAAKKGYELFKGKNTRIKAVTLIIVSILCVVIAELAVQFIFMVQAITADPELSVYFTSAGDYISFFFNIVFTDTEVLTAIGIDILLGLVFAFLGIFSTLKEVFTETSSKSGRALRLD